MPNFDLNSTNANFPDRRRNGFSRVVGVLNGTQTVANQFQINGPNTATNPAPVAGVEIGQVVDIVSTAGVVRGAARTITAISGTTTLTVTYSGADIATDANTDLVILSEGANPIGAPTNYDNIGGLDARLTVINGSYFTANQLNKMGANDKVYALRLNDSPASL